MKFIVQNCIAINVEYIVRIVPYNKVSDINEQMYRSRIYLSDNTFVDSVNKIEFILDLLEKDERNK